MDYLTIALVLIVIGVILLGAEILLPTGGLLVVGALLCFAAGVGTILYYGDTIEAVVAIIGLAIGLPIAGFVAVHAWRRLSIGSSLDSGIADASAISPQQTAEMASLKGRVGKTVSPLRPSGTAEFDGRRYDAMTEGMMIDSGVWVRCVGVRGTSLLVREMESPTDISDINPEGPKESQPLDDLDLGIDDRGA